jgi:hypothetical protein
MEHGPEVLFGVCREHVDGKWTVHSVLIVASHYQNVEMVKLTLEAGFDNKEAMYVAAFTSINRD